MEKLDEKIFDEWWNELEEHGKMMAEQKFNGMEKPSLMSQDLFDRYTAFLKKNIHERFS